MKYRITIAAFACALVTTGAISPAVAQNSRPTLRQTADDMSVANITTTCKNNGRNHIVRTYFRGPARYTLRCGTSTWGWKHIQHRWSNSFDNKISNAIASGLPNGSGYSTWTLPPCSRETFRTILGTPAAVNDLRTAYKVTATAAC